jgi:murein DD-endopeptidase MepM/ murein hydrolase activator NlpD
MYTLWWANRLKAKDELHVGQKLYIPPTDGVLYTAQEGDTVDTIAAKFRANVEEVIAFNDLEGDTVVIGQQLMVPDGRGAAIPTPRPTAAPKPRAPSSRSSSSGSSGHRSSGGGGGSCGSCHFGGSMRWPVPGGHISQFYHYGHYGLDIAADYGSPVIAAASGRVTFAGWKNNGGGYQVWISHGNGIYTTYNHMSSVAVSRGQSVGRGQRVGRVGATGWATGPHCHFEVWIGPIWSGGHRVNPLKYL